MSEQYQIRKAIRKQAQKKRSSRKKYCTNLLKQKGIQFESRNNGVHLIINNGSEVIDYWPSTGKFIVRNGVRGYGVKNLIERILKPDHLP